MITAKKKYGQNFLKDKNLLMKIVSDSFLDGFDVIEIGPGLGALTEYIAKTAKRVIAYEIDTDLKNTLDTLEDKYKNLKVIYKDFLNVDLHDDKTKYSLNDETYLIGNLPYYITTPIIFKFMNTDYLKAATIMVQKEVGDRIISKPNSKNYNALSVMIQYQADIKIIASVNKKMFYPVPEVDSMVIRIIKKNNIGQKLLPEFNEFVKASFIQKRKTLVNNLSDYYKVSKEKVLSFLDENDLSGNIRAEQIPVEKFYLLVSGWPYGNI